MNFLAHLWLAGPDPDARLGQWLGDFVKGAAWKDYPPEVARAILAHRRLDRYTDAHPGLERCRACVPPPFVRFRGIVLDLFIDHWLARDFEAWAGEPLAVFAAGAYRDLGRQRELMLERARRAFDRMRADDWLTAYATRAGMTLALRGLGRRLRRPVPLEEAVGLGEEHAEVWAPAIARFLRDVRAEAGREGA